MCADRSILFAWVRNVKPRAEREPRASCRVTAELARQCDVVFGEPRMASTPTAASVLLAALLVATLTATPGVSAPAELPDATASVSASIPDLIEQAGTTGDEMERLHLLRQLEARKIGRASCRERV